MPSNECSIVWFRRDLRIEDNPALASGIQAGPVVALFIWAPEEEHYFYPGRVSRWWLKHSLTQLISSLGSLGASFISKRSTNTISTLLHVVRSTGATRIFFNQLYDPISLVRDRKINEILSAEGLIVSTFNAELLYKPWEINDAQGLPFTTFTAFWESCLNNPDDPESLLLPPKKIIAGDVSGCPSDTLIFEEESEKGSNELLARTWAPGWVNADVALTAFVNGPLIDYSSNRNMVDHAATSHLSPHLHFGELSVRKVFHVLRMKQVLWANGGCRTGVESVNFFLKSIGLREYSRYMSFNHPFSHERPLNGHLQFFPWVVDERFFKLWKQGRTGYPLVDAGMRELWATGWLHNRIRVVVSSFFVKVLQLPWRWGMRYFWDTLLDADLESDILGWQYISGALPDGRDLDLIDDPQVEGYQLDPEGEYVRRWLPELARLPTKWIHHPWDAPRPVLEAAGLELGSNYPLRIVTLQASEARLQHAISAMWQSEAASRAAIENGSEEGLGESSSLQQFPFPEESSARGRHISPVLAHGDQMVPSMDPSPGVIAEGARDVTENIRVGVSVNFRNSEESASCSSGGSREGGVVPVWSPPGHNYPDRLQPHQIISQRWLSEAR